MLGFEIHVQFQNGWTDTVAQQRRYQTKQRELVSTYLAQHADRYLSVDEVWSGVCSQGAVIGRTTVYRNLEVMTADGSARKATAPGGEARYRAAGDEATGQLVCLGCGRALPLDCHMVVDFSAHVLEHHAFRIDPTRTVLYGFCEQCMEATQ